MSNGNSVTVVGNLTRDPELRYTSAGQTKVTFGLAVNRRWQNRTTNEWEEATSFFNVVAWGQLGDNVAESLGQGARVVVSGRLDQRSWETEQGEKRSVVEINADDVGPSLRWATVEIKKNERRTPGEAGGASNGGGAAAPGGRPVANEPAGGGYGYDEEPF
jgi:single-strand DNA-binding protein